MARRCQVYARRSCDGTSVRCKDKAEREVAFVIDTLAGVSTLLRVCAPHYGVLLGAKGLEIEEPSKESS